MKKLLLPFLSGFVLLFNACTDKGPEGPVEFRQLYQGSLGGMPAQVIVAHGLNTNNPAHWQHVEEYGEWAVKSILGTGSNGIVYFVDSDVNAPTDGNPDAAFQKHTVAETKWLPTQDAAFRRDPFETHAGF